MSEERLEQLERKWNIVERIIKVGWLLIGGAFAVGVWVTTLEMRSRDTNETVTALNKQMLEMNVWKAQTSESRYTTIDHNRYAIGVTEAINQSDKRTTRVEDAVTEMKKALDRIEAKIGSK